MKIGLFGGTFDPPHIGHLIVAQDARSRLRLDRLVFVPAAQPPHKLAQPISPAAIRLAMLQAAIAGDPDFRIDDIELRREGPSYAVDTLRAYRERYPRDELYLLVGADQFAEIDTWREAPELGRLARVAVLSRAGERRVPSPRSEVQPEYVDVTRIDVSATDVRRRVAAREPVRYLVPDAVLELIREHGLYSAAADARARTSVHTPG